MLSTHFLKTADTTLQLKFFWQLPACACPLPLLLDYYSFREMKTISWAPLQFSPTPRETLIIQIPRNISVYVDYFQDLVP